jgi:hypothetical protein
MLMPIVMALLATLLLSAFSTALVLTTSADSLVAENFRYSQEAVYAADAALERGIDELDAAADWTDVPGGPMQSTFTDGLAGTRALSDGSTIDLAQLVNVVNCRKRAPCSTSALAAVTAQRPWGANNPVWRLIGYGPLSGIVPGRTIASPYYVVIMVADDPAENDNDPVHDGGGSANPGAGVLALRAEAFGPRGSHRVVEATLARAGGIHHPRADVLSWRLLP